MARACADADNVSAEFAVLVRSDLKRRGLGTLLLAKLVRYCRQRGLRRLWGSVMTENTAMLQLAARLGFRVRSTADGIAEIELDLRPG